MSGHNFFAAFYLGFHCLYLTTCLGVSQIQLWDKVQVSMFVFVCLFVFVALRPKSTAMVIVGLSVHLTTLFPGQA